MLHKGGKAGRQNFREGVFAGFIERAGQQQCACIVIDAIAVRAVGHRMHGVLEQAGVVAHRQEMVQVHVWRRGAVWHDLVRRGARNHPQPVALPRILEGGQVALGAALPCHGTACQIGLLAHRLPARFVGEQFRNFVADCCRVAEGNEDAAPIGQQFARVPIGR